jgi:hypothetical protein
LAARSLEDDAADRTADRTTSRTDDRDAETQSARILGELATYVSADQDVPPNIVLSWLRRLRPGAAPGASQRAPTEGSPTTRRGTSP